MLDRSVIAALLAPWLVVGSIQGAAAQELEACRSATSPESRVAACTQVIAGPAFSNEQKAVAYRNRGRSRVEAGALAAGLEDLDEAIKRSPADPQALATRAQARIGSGAVDGAIADYTAMIRLKPNWSQAYIGRGHAHLVKGAAPLAIADFSEAIRIAPESASAHNNRGLAYRKAGDLERALDDYTQAIARNPIYALAYANRGYLHEERGAKDSAIADYRRALLIDSTLSGARDGLGRLGAFGALASESQQLVREGRTLVDANCAKCHAVGPAGESSNPKAPAFRRLHALHPMQSLREPLARGVAAPHDEMPKFRLADADIDKIVAYINSLETKP